MLIYGTSKLSDNLKQKVVEFGNEEIDKLNLKKKHNLISNFYGQWSRRNDDLFYIEILDNSYLVKIDIDNDKDNYEAKVKILNDNLEKIDEFSVYSEKISKLEKKTTYYLFKNVVILSEQNNKIDKAN